MIRWSARASYLDCADGGVREIVAVVDDIPAEVIFMYGPE